MEITTNREGNMETYTINFINQYGDLQVFETRRGWDAAHESRKRLRALLGEGPRISIKEIR